MSKKNPAPAKLVIEWIGGNCPVQAEGYFDSRPLFFRARGDSWRVEIQDDSVPGFSKWVYCEKYKEWPDAGFMSNEKAKKFIYKAVDIYIERKARGNLFG